MAADIIPSGARKRKPVGFNRERTVAITESVMVDAVVALDEAAKALARIVNARRVLVADANHHLGRKSA